MFKYDPFQEQAIKYINEGYSVIVSAPTGAGKTVIAEHVITDCLKKGEKVIYTAPIKALSNQKYREFQQNFPGKVGILTGDITLNASAQTLIMTTEIFRNKILEERSSLHDYSWIIYDEIHYLDDWERGSVWEESLIFLPEHMKLLGLSATIPNIDEMARWLESIHQRPIKIIEEDKRPVPLHFFFQCQGRVYDDFKRLVKDAFHGSMYSFHRGPRGSHHKHFKPNKIFDLMQYLSDEDLLPCIYFVFSRKRTEILADEVRTFDFLTDQEKVKIKVMYADLCKKFDLEEEASAKKLRPFVERGIAYHHAGMLPTLKEVVERLFTSRLIKAIFTTETFALGINMPARTVVFDELRKFYGVSHGPLKTRDFYQMAGRAGRRSIDTEGFVFCRVNPAFASPGELHRTIYNKPEKVLSRFNASYATVLNLYQKYGEKLYDIYPRSFHYFQEEKNGRKKALKLLNAKVDLLKELGHIVDQKLTEKGIFASRVYGYELILSELFEHKILEELNDVALGILSVAIVFEPRKDSTVPRLSNQAKKMQALTDEMMVRISLKEREYNVKPLSKFPFYHLAPAMEGWLRGETFDEILRQTIADEGEVVRYFRMSVQILREILETPVADEVKNRIYRLINLINRDVVDSEKQLRN